MNTPGTGSNVGKSATESMRKAGKLHKATDKVLKCNNELISALSELSRIASDIYGQDLEATICNGDEIEFRRNGDAFDCLLVSDILAEL